MGLLNWIKNILDFSIEVGLDKEESFNYFLVKYDTNLCGINDSCVLETTLTLEEVEDMWFDYSNGDAMDYVHHVEELNDLEVYASVDSITEEEYNRLKEEDSLDDWLI